MRNSFASIAPLNKAIAAEQLGLAAPECAAEV